jgi:hypothetical protein
VGQIYTLPRHTHTLQNFFPLSIQRSNGCQSSPYRISNAGNSEDFSCCVDYAISNYVISFQSAKQCLFYPKQLLKNYDSFRHNFKVMSILKKKEDNTRVAAFFCAL